MSNLKYLTKGARCVWLYKDAIGKTNTNLINTRYIYLVKRKCIKKKDLFLEIAKNAILIIVSSKLQKAVIVKDNFDALIFVRITS